MDSRSGDPMGFGHFGQSYARSAVANDAGAVDLERPAADAPAFEPNTPLFREPPGAHMV
jgi:hypothetical protein